MYRIDKAEISGFWGNYSVNLDFDTDVNFLIGVNGSGKTTIINMIAATLSADFPTLDRLPFSKIKIQLSKARSKARPVIELDKKPSKNSPYCQITYRIKEKVSDKFEVFSLDELQEERFLRGDIPLRHRRRFLSRVNRGLVARLNEFINVSWLSIHRTAAPKYMSEESNYESSVDQKLGELNDGLSRHFSMLSKRVAQEVEDFQRNIIFSLLTDQTESVVFSSVKKFDMEKEKKALTEIFLELGLNESRTGTRIKKHFDTLGEALNKWDTNDSIGMRELMAVVGSFRVNKVVKSWNALLEKKKEILFPKENFLNVINEMLQKKSLEINEANEIEVVTQSGKRFPLTSLSSGEKQLFIILGEALLQEETQWIYIADEPELSLHVLWQESLIDNLRTINPRAQIICATHSPDIVGKYSNKVIDMESRIN
ncbi:MAG: ATP-binding protein [Gammaproteobacteria bacterium]|nr:ATP-binding protein [Gammaproteobacteria bacterium]